MCTDKQKRIYNHHLVESRKAKGKPFRIRKDFSKLKPEHKIVLEKLDRLFSKYSDINVSNFFIAPYKIYPNDEYFDLKFYTTQKAIFVYKLYMESLKVEKIEDSNENIEVENNLI
jgi:hypothetical protein